MKPIELISKRLILRRTREGDANNLFNYTNDSECSRFLTRRPHTHIEQTQKFLDKWCNLAWEVEDENFSWVVSLASNDEAVGVFIVIIEEREAQVHFGIRREFWRQGYASELLKVGTDWLLSKGTLQRVWTVCDLENIGSFKALEKSGFKREGLLKKWSVLPAFGDSARDCYIYSRLVENM
jgi:ribosomal-protein-alanine N-acetyltransferase